MDDDILDPARRRAIGGIAGGIAAVGMAGAAVAQTATPTAGQNASAPAAIRNGAEGSVAACHTASATSPGVVTAAEGDGGAANCPAMVIRVASSSSAWVG